MYSGEGEYGNKISGPIFKGQFDKDVFIKGTVYYNNSNFLNKVGT